MKKVFLLCGLMLLLLSQVYTPVFSQEPSTPIRNNRFGIHILDETDLADAAALVNSNGGEWGYVTLVIRQDERDSARWSGSTTRTTPA